MSAITNMKAYTSFLSEAYRAIFDRTCIDFWGYVYFDLEGRHLQLNSEKYIIDEILNKELYIEQNLCKKNYQHSNYYVCHVPNDNVIASGIKKCLLERNYTFFIDFFYQDSSHVEMVTFASNHQPGFVNNFVVNNLDYFKMIAHNMAAKIRRLHTKENFSTLPKECIIRMNELFSSENCENENQLKEIILQSSNHQMVELIKDTVFDYNSLPFSFMGAKNLTHREKELIYLYYNNFNLHRIASIFEISKRTVERHFESIKKKLNCENNGQIIPALIRFDANLKKILNT